MILKDGSFELIIWPVLIKMKIDKLEKIEKELSTTKQNGDYTQP